VIGPFGLAFYKQITGEFVCGANGPSGVHLEDLRDSIELKVRLAGYMSSDGVADVVSGQSVGFKADEDPEVFSRWGGHRWSLPLAISGSRFLWWVMRSWCWSELVSKIRGSYWRSA
ncbi:hypothetical protein H634G_11592, partial [Metarhizium anisopliae BRIP 53293]